jgi:hypothetical protein
MSQSKLRAGRIIAAAAILPAMFFAVSSHPTFAKEYLADATPTSAAPTSPAQDQAAAQVAPTAAPKLRSASADRIEQRIAALHQKLHVTSDQEPLWNDVAQVMRDNGKKMRDEVAERSAKLKTMNAIDDLRSYELITDEHAEGLKHLVPAFAALYAKMSPNQQKNADHVFGEQQHQTSRRG